RIRRSSSRWPIRVRLRRAIRPRSSPRRSRSSTTGPRTSCKSRTSSLSNAAGGQGRAANRRASSPAPVSPPSIDAFIDALWLEDGLAANTLAAYRRDLQAFQEWLREQPAGRTLDAAETADIESWFAARHADSRASTANRRLAVLRRYYAWALRT